MEREDSRPLDAQLEEMQATLEARLSEACGVDVKRLDTGQSVRFERVLTSASEAARKVVSLKRKQRGRAPRVSSADTSPSAIGEHRQFVDQLGVTWDAFAVLPTADPRGLARLPEQYQHGWLCFESPTEKRRLGPIPDDWRSVNEEVLRRYRDSAQPVQPRPSHPETRDSA
jgi:hypothetical protein